MINIVEVLYKKSRNIVAIIKWYSLYKLIIKLLGLRQFILNYKEKDID